MVLDEGLERLLQTQYIRPLLAGGSALGGLLLHGPAGSGKSSIAELLALRCNASLLRMDVGEVFSRYVGDSERLMKAYVQTAVKYEGP